MSTSLTTSSTVEIIVLKEHSGKLCSPS